MNPLETASISEVLETYTHLIGHADAHIDALTSEYQNQMQCKQGCSSCCTNRFEIRFVEAWSLYQACQALPWDQQQALLKRLFEKDTDAPQPCPLLVNDACSVYLSRPLLCRAYGLILRYQTTVSTCHLNFNSPLEGQPLKQLDLEPYFELFDDLSIALQLHLQGTLEIEKRTIKDWFQLFQTFK